MRNISRLLYEVTSKLNDDCYCMYCLHLFKTESKLKSSENICKNHNYCKVNMPELCRKILKFNYKQKSTQKNKNKQ